jgi:predicted DNA binding protein
MGNKPKAIVVRIEKEKELLLEQLKKTPIVQIACEKTGIGRATYYRWRKEDSKFSNAADAAILEGSLLVNDMAESQLLGAIREGNMTSIIFWLKHHHPAYETRIELRQAFTRPDEALTDEQNEAVKKALELIKQDTKYKLEGEDKNEKNNKLE